MHQYAAGLIDGEGYIGIQETGGSFQVRLKVAMSDKGRPALLQMVRIYGGRINDSERRNERSRNVCTWVTTGEHAASIIRQIKPWLLVKDHAAEIAIQFQLMLESADKLPNGRRKWTTEMRGKASELKIRIQEANRRGPDPEPNPRTPQEIPLAKYRAGHWWDAEDSLFGPEPFDGKFPTSGRMVGGIIYEVKETETCRNCGETQLLPTPAAYDGMRGGSQDPDKRRAGGHSVSLDNVASHKLLPTPTARDHKDSQIRREPHRPDDVDTLSRALTDVDDQPPATNWGKYSEAVHRWERIHGEAPPPTELGASGKHRLNAAFAEWHMGLEPGHVTDVPGISRANQLKAIGNGVVPQQAAAALRDMLNNH